MSILIDNDAIKKLCRYDLQDQAASHFGGYENLLALETAPYSMGVFDLRRGLKLAGSDAALDRIKAFLENIGRIHVDPNNPHLVTLGQVPQIDVGEVALFAVATEQVDSVVFTGDKRAILALAHSLEAVNVREKLNGRVRCLEQVVAELIEVYGFDAVCKAICSDSGADTALRLCFSSRRESSAVDGLRSYYSDLSITVPGLLTPPPALLT